MTITKEHGRRIFALQVSGLEYRYHSTTPPSTTSLDANIATSIPYVDQEGISTVGTFSASVDPSGGIGQYSPVSVTLQIDRKGGLGDPGVIFGRCGARSAIKKAQIISDVSRQSTTIKVNTDLSGLTYPKLLHIGSETIRASSATSSTITATRGQGNTTPQFHTYGLEGSFVPEVTTEITTFRGRRAKLFMAHQYPDGTVSDYVEIINGFIEQSPIIEAGDSIALSIVPLTALIDTELADKINQTRLLQGYHYYDGNYGSAIEYALGLSYDPIHEEPALYPDTSSTITANTFNAIILSNYGSEDYLADFDASLPSGPDRDEYIGSHPRYPKLKKYINVNLATDGVYPTATAYSLSLNGYVVNADSSPSTAFTAGEITNAGFFNIAINRYELKQHELGNQEVKQWPKVINDVLASDGPSSTQGFSGGFAQWRLNADNIIRASKLSNSPFAGKVVLWNGYNGFIKFKEHIENQYGSATPRAFTANGTNINYPPGIGLYYPLDIGEQEDPFYPDQGDKFIEVTASTQPRTGFFGLRDLAKAYYQNYESKILIEGTLGLPSTATAGETYDVIVLYYDRQSESTKRQTFQVTHETAVSFGGSTVGRILHIADSNSFSNNVSFADWQDSERVLIFRGSQVIEDNAGQIMLKLLESGGGNEINGDYDLLGLGLNISSSDIDEESFLAVGASCPFVFTDQFAGDGSSLRDIFDSLLKLMGACLVMKRDESTGRSRLSLQPLGAERSADSSLTIEAGDWLADQPPHWDIYEDIVTQIKYEFDYSAEEDSYLSEVIFNNQEAINRYGGERSKITLSLPGVSSRDFGRNAGDNFNFFLPSSSRIFNILSNPLRVWRGSIGTGSSAFLDVGSYVTVSSPHLRGYSDSYGVTNGVGMVRSINQELMSEGCEIELLTTGLVPVAWNATAQVSFIPTNTSVLVETDSFSRSDVNDVSFFKAGDIVDYLPQGDHDNAITGLEIQSISSNTITFTSSHGISTIKGTLEPTTYSNASADHQSDAYLANSSNIINTTIEAQEFS
jgi:hypothetical protein